MIGAGFRLVSVQAGHLVTETIVVRKAEKIAETVEELWSVVVAESDMCATRLPKVQVTKPPPAPDEQMVKAIGLQVSRITAVVAKTKGKGISNVIQEANKRLQTLARELGKRKDPI